MSCIGGHIWTWAASPECRIPVGTPCDCGLIKYASGITSRERELEEQLTRLRALIKALPNIRRDTAGWLRPNDRPVARSDDST